MKQQKVSKLTLNKTTIAKLNNEVIGAVKGGTGTITKTEYTYCLTCKYESCWGYCEQNSSNSMSFKLTITDIVI